MKPKRIQRKRTKGRRMPDGAVYVGRPTTWGNPYKVKKSCDGYRWYVSGPPPHVYQKFVSRESANKYAKDMYRAYLAQLPNYMSMQIKELRGKDLACWCPLDQPCHADVLLELANK